MKSPLSMSFLGTIDMSLSSHTFHIWNALFFALLPGSSYVVLFLIASEKCQATTVKACLSFPGRSKKRVPPFLKNRESVIFHVEKKNHHVTCTWPISTFVSRDWRGRSTSLLLFFPVSSIDVLWVSPNSSQSPTGNSSSMVIIVSNSHYIFFTDYRKRERDKRGIRFFAPQVKQVGWVVDNTLGLCGYLLLPFV